MPRRGDRYADCDCSNMGERSSDDSPGFPDRAGRNARLSSDCRNRYCLADLCGRRNIGKRLSSRTPGYCRVCAIASCAVISPAANPCTYRRTTKESRFCRYNAANVNRLECVLSNLIPILELPGALSMFEPGGKSGIRECKCCEVGS